MTIYKRLRTQSGLTQEAVSNQLFFLYSKTIEPSVLSKIENGKKDPTADEIILLAKLYNAPELYVHYCNTICPLNIKTYGLHLYSIDNISMDLMNALDALKRFRENIYRILEDGKISPAEWTPLLEIISALKMISENTKALRLFMKKQGKNIHNNTAYPPNEDTPYARARKQVFSSYVKAANTLGIERSKLSQIELGTVTPHPEEVVFMAEGYHAPQLYSYYCINECKLITALGFKTPPLEYDSLDRISVCLMSALHYLDNTNQVLQLLFDDSQIDESEYDHLCSVFPVLSKLVYCADSIELFVQKQLAEKARCILADGTISESERNEYYDILKKLGQLGADPDYISFLKST